MELSTQNFDALIERYVGEIDMLVEALSTETDPSLRQELDQALQESQPLTEELRIARDIFVEALEAERALTEDEMEAFKYFGFTITDEWKQDRSKPKQRAAPPAPAAPVVVVPEPRATAPSAIPQAASFDLAPAAGVEQRRVTTTVTTVHETYEESETDPEFAAPPQSHRAYRALTPDYDDHNYTTTTTTTAVRPSVAAVPVVTVTPSRGASPAPLPPQPYVASAPPSTVSASLPPPPTPPRYTDDDVEERARVIAQRLVTEERLRMEREFASRPPVVDENAIRRAVAAEAEHREAWMNRMIQDMTDDHHQKLGSLEAALRDARSDVVRAETSADRDQRRVDEAQAVITRLEAELSAKKGDLGAERDKSAALIQSLDHERDNHRASLEQAYASYANEARAQWIDYINDRFVPLTTGRYEPTIEALQRQLTTMTEHFSVELERIKNECALSCGVVHAGETSQHVTNALANASHALRLATDASGVAVYGVNAAVATGTESDVLDAAVAEELTQLGLPTAIAVRRIGPNGEYFIDRRVQLRLMNSRVFVKRLGAQSSTYEPLTKYIVKLYAPIFVGSDSEAFTAALHATGQVSPPGDRYASLSLNATSVQAPSSSSRLWSLPRLRARRRHRGKSSWTTTLRCTPRNAFEGCSASNKY